METKMKKKKKLKKSDLWHPIPVNSSTKYLLSASIIQAYLEILTISKSESISSCFSFMLF